jgi:hypothetical protein
MATFGHLGQGTTLATSMNGDRKFALRVVAPEDGVVTAVSVDMQNLGSEIQAFRAGVYNDAPTISGATLVDDSDSLLLSPGATRQWVNFNSGLNASVSAGNIYWLTLHAGATGGNAAFYYDSGVGSELLADDSWGDGLSATFGTATTAANSIAIYAQYTAVSSQVPGLKRIVLGRVRAGV